MLNVTLIAVGKLKERYLTDACAEYEKRLGAYCRLRVVEVDEYRLPQNPSEAQIQAGIEAEGKEILAKIPAGSYLIPLCIEGQTDQLGGAFPDPGPCGSGREEFHCAAHRRFLRTVGGTQEEGRPAAVHVPDDLPAPAGTGDGTGTALSGDDHFPGSEVS